MGVERRGGDTVLVECSLIREVIADGCCPLHLRLRLGRLLDDTAEQQTDGSNSGEEAKDQPPAIPLVFAVGDIEVAERRRNSYEPFSALDSRCLATVAAYLPLAEILTLRTCSREPLQWVMERSSDEHGARCWIYDRIRARLWMRRVADVTQGTRDESVFETKMRSLADDALRSRMETEMQVALQHMEEQIHQFQTEVDRRLEEQERHVRRMVEERVQQELDAILASEVVKVQAMVEERVRERVGATFRREVRETVKELQGKLDALVEENELLRDAFAEANFRAKCMFWALHPPLMHTAALAIGCLGPKGAPALLSLRRRAMLAGCWHPGIDRLAWQRGLPAVAPA